MRLKRINWGQVEAGQVIQFRYKGRRTGKSRLRTCLILNEKHMYKRKDGRNVRLVHALQLKAVPRVPGTRVLTESNIKKVLKKTGNIEIVDGNYKVDINRFGARRGYNKLRQLVEQFGIYRTFSWHICKTRAAFIDSEFEWPKELIKDLQQIPVVVDEEDI